jgi:predicted DNA-binding transcriptional regulator AlpA
VQLLGKKEVAARIGVHPEHLARMVREGKFPKPIRLGGNGKTNRVRFVESEVEGWIATKMAARV